MGHEIVENFHAPAPDGSDLVEAEIEQPKRFVVALFQPAVDRLLLKRLPPPKQGLIVRPEIAEEQSEYGYVVAVGKGVEVPVDTVAKFSKFSGPEEIHFEDEQDGDDFVLVYKHDVRGWFQKPGGELLYEPYSGKQYVKDRATGAVTEYAGD